jgi:hypothetical protein
LPAKRAPELGEHNEVILRELEFDPQTISRFRAGGAVATAGPQGGKTYSNLAGLSDTGGVPIGRSGSPHF